MTRAEAIETLEADGLHEQAAALKAAKRVQACRICKTMLVPQGQHACWWCD
jgi:hypothetical protein